MGDSKVVGWDQYIDMMRMLGNRLGVGKDQGETMKSLLL